MLSHPQAFDPDGPGLKNGNLYGLPHTLEESEVHLIPVPWDATVSYRSGTCSGPQAILEASSQVEVYDPRFSQAWEPGISLLPLPKMLAEANREAREKAVEIIEALEQGSTLLNHSQLLKGVNQACERMIDWVEKQAKEAMDEGKCVAVLGGDHSTPLGLLRALADRYSEFGILQIDAHMDLRNAYEGFTYSHASIMHNVLQIPSVGTLIQVGVRDYCQEEIQVHQENQGRIFHFPGREIANRLLEGISWKEQIQEMLAPLPQSVYISFDIDGLEPTLCPDTGTPVPGGLSFEQALYLIDQLASSGREIIGFDLCEVNPGENEWNAIVGARVLYRLYLARLISRRNTYSNE